MALEMDIPENIASLWTTTSPEVVKYPASVLRQAAKIISRPTPATRNLVDKMKKTMIESNGVGLAAPQIGVSERVIIYRLPEENQQIKVIVNPRIISKKGEQVGPEGCLSVPYLEGDVPRAREIIVKGLDMLGRPLKRRASDFEARVIQHEVDHLDGILFFERASQDTLKWHIPISDEDAENEPPLD
jgi:peptide deformylase